MSGESEIDRIEKLEKQVAALKKLLVGLVDSFNDHDHQFDYSNESGSIYDYDATTSSPESYYRVDQHPLERAWEKE